MKDVFLDLHLVLFMAKIAIQWYCKSNNFQKLNFVSLKLIRISYLLMNASNMCSFVDECSVVYK